MKPLSTRDAGIIVGVMLATGCSSRSAAPEPAPAHRDSVVSRVVVTLDTAQADLPLQMREARARAESAAARVDTIVVHPDTLKLRVGESIQPFALLTIEGRTAEGERVPHFAPLLRAADRNIAQFTPAGLLGRRPGLTWIVLSSFTRDPAAKTVRSMVWILVEPQ